MWVFSRFQILCMPRPFKVGRLYRTSLEIFALFPKMPPRKYDHSIYKCTRGGVQKSSIGNHCHPNLFCGMRAPSLVISTTSIGNQTKKGIIKSFMVYNILTDFVIAPQFRKYIYATWRARNKMTFFNFCVWALLN